ncbi:MAG: DUF2029 domain-containing protein [Actinomycetales bacterium]|nr:DUF2029 domain-containing protein [Actinomycetales bacterium]
MATRKPSAQEVRQAQLLRAKQARKKNSLAESGYNSSGVQITIAVLMILGFIATRYWAAGAGLQWISYPNGKALFSDVTLYDFWGNNIANGIFPNSPGIPQNQLWTNDAWQYPALAALIFIVGYKIHYGMIGFIWLAVIADFALLAVLLWAGRQRRDSYGQITSPANYLPAGIWLLAPIFIGPLLVGRFDVFPTLAMVVALVSVASSRRYGIWTAVGFLLKVWPVFGLLGLSRSKFKEGFAWFAGVSAVVTGALYLWWSGSLSFISGQGKRGLQIESLGALPFMMFGKKDDRNAITFRYGAWEVTAPAAKYVSLFLTLALLVLIGILVWWRWNLRLEIIPAADVVLLAVLISMCTSRVLSPQYSIWVVGLLAAAAFERQRNFWVIATLLLTSVAFGQYLFPGNYSDFQLLHSNGVLIQTIRLACLLAATVMCWINVQRRLVMPECPPGRILDEEAMFKPKGKLRNLRVK